MAQAPLEIWTIGHSTRQIGEFISLLQEHRIEVLADVRQFPGSRRFPQFGREALAQALAASGIQYEHFPELGGRRRARPDSPNTAWRNAAFRGYADYMMGDAFGRGMRRLLSNATATRTALMCAEALWWRCHRGLISDYLKAQGVRVTHILGPGKVQEHPFTSAAQLVDGRLSYAARSAEPELRLVSPEDP